MPSFIKTPKDESRWKKAKEAAGKTLTESDGDRFWALTNSIYQKISKAKDELEKARKGFRVFDPSEEDESSMGDDWLKENEPDYEEYGDNEDPEAHQQSIEEDLGETAEEPSQQRGGRFNQPSREDLIAMRNYTRPWEQRARETAQLNADPLKNPVLAQQGNLIEARNTAHADKNSAYKKLTSSEEYKNADPISQMEMDDKFEKDWHSSNPEHIKNAVMAHDEAHKKGKSIKESHRAAKDAQIQHILSGGQTGEGYSLEEGMQHAGGVKGEEGTQASIKHDPAASFAMGNEDFIRQYSKDYASKNKKVSGVEDMMHYDEGSKKDIKRILGDAPAKDPKFEQFFAHYYPLIGMSAHKTLNKLGLDPKHPDVDMSMLHEAGMHGLVQAINDYDHDHPSKASFATHAGNKIRGLQMTAMKNQDIIPSEVRQAQKKFSTQKRQETPVAPTAQASLPQQPKVNVESAISRHPSSADIMDRLTRVKTQRPAIIRRPSVKTGGEESGGQ